MLFQNKIHLENHIVRVSKTCSDIKEGFFYILMFLLPGSLCNISVLCSSRGNGNTACNLITSNRACISNVFLFNCSFTVKCHLLRRCKI